MQALQSDDEYQTSLLIEGMHRRVIHGTYYTRVIHRFLKIGVPKKSYF